jgi:hypothetical protein
MRCSHSAQPRLQRHTGIQRIKRKIAQRLECCAAELIPCEVCHEAQVDPWELREAVAAHVEALEARQAQEHLRGFMAQAL